MSADTYSMALAQRRGTKLDPAMIKGEIDAPHTQVNQHLGLNSSSDGGERQGTPSHQGKTQYDRESPTHLDEHTPPVHEGQAPSPTPDRKSPDHKDEHTQVAGEQSRGLAYPHSQSVGAGGGDLHDQIRNEVTGHASLEEYELLKDLHPRSLGERAKMMALKDQYAGDRSKG